MIVRSVQDVLNTDRDVRGEAFASRRLLLAKDGVGFSLNETTVDAGTKQTMWYKHHIEANYVVEGEGTVTDLATGQVHPLGPGSTYTLNMNDRHVVEAKTRMKFVCIFTPPLTGKETHDKDGSYLPAAEESSS